MTAGAMLYAQEFLEIPAPPIPERPPRESVWRAGYIRHLARDYEPGPRAVIEIGDSANWFDGTIPWMPLGRNPKPPKQSVNYPRGVGRAIEFDKGPAMALFLEVATDAEIEHINEGRARMYPFVPLLSRPSKTSKRSPV